MKAFLNYLASRLGRIIPILAAFLLASNFTFSQAKDVKEAEIYVTAESTNQLLTCTGFHAFDYLEQPDENYPTIIIDPNRTFQSIEGFGGAFTDAAAVTFGKLSKEEQDEFLKASFDPVEGNGYNLCRTTIHSCDYSDVMYTYDTVPGDKDLKHFSIDHDMKYRIPFIKAAQEASKGNLRLFASPWSPPGWMKTNGEMLHGGKLLPEYDQTWADYFVKYLDAYKKQGIPIWGVTVQNEALAVQIWESCIYTAKEESDFVRDYLGPTFQKKGEGDVKIMIWDHNRGLIYQRAEAAYEDPAASRYIWGTAFHWYVGDHFDNVGMVHDAFPDKMLLYTEGGMDGSWNAATRLAKSMIMDLNNWTNGWVFWNLLLDQTGGPRHVGLLRGSNIVTADLINGKLIFNPPYYVFGQFSRFIKRGAKRIACTSTSDGFIATSFVNPDGKIATVILNLEDYEQLCQLWINGKVLKFRSPANGVTTVVF